VSAWDTVAADDVDAPVTQPPADGPEAVSVAGSPTPPPTLACEQCHHEVPALDFCVRCGDPLLVERQRAGATALGHRRGGQFAAVPEESAYGIHLSTLFPQLPRGDMATFQLVFAIGVGAIVALAIVGLYPVAFAAALVLVPLMMVLYMWDVDVYEDEPLRVIGYTAVWGTVTGLIAGLLIRAFVPLDIGAFGSISTETILARGVVIPLIGGAVMLAGPLVLLPYRRFNDVLDGATFGATAAVTFVAAQGLAQALDLFAGGIRPAGDPLPWVVRLVGLGVATPVIAAGAIGATAGAFWLRYRAPVADRHRLGLVGRPVAAIIGAGLMLVAGAVGQLVLPFLAALVWLAFLAAVAMLWLRAVIHLGLLQEASEIEIGPPIRCPNCTRMTPFHSFCGHCGISLRALPKTAARPSADRATADQTHA
jgi:hypothetical protein